MAIQTPIMTSMTVSMDSRRSGRTREEIRDRTDDEATDDGQTERGEEVQIGQRQGGERRIGAPACRNSPWAKFTTFIQPEDERQPDPSSAYVPPSTRPFTRC